MNGYKTILTAVISILSGGSLLAGVEIDPATLELLRDNIEQVIGGGMVSYGIIMAILRKFTSGPLGPKAALIKMLLSALGKEQK